MDSLLRQTLGDQEVVAVDDGSTDDSAQRLEGWAARDGRVRVLRAHARGLVPALNQGLAACRGAYVARMDADDLCAADRFEAQVAFLAAHPDVDLVATQVEGFVDGGVPLGAGMVRYLEWMNGLCTPEAIARERFVESPLVHPSVLARRETLQAAGYRDEPWPEDYDLWLRLLQRGARLAKVPRVLLRWRDHGARATRTQDRYRQDRHRDLKVAFLLEGPLRDRPPVIFWGVGIEGKPLLRRLRAAGVPVPVAIDRDPRKVGQIIHGARVLHERELGAAQAAHPGAVVLVAVGVPTARAGIRDTLTAHGVEEGAGAFFLR